MQGYKHGICLPPLLLLPLLFFFLLFPTSHHSPFSKTHGAFWPRFLAHGNTGVAIVVPPKKMSSKQAFQKLGRVLLVQFGTRVVTFLINIAIARLAPKADYGVTFVYFQFFINLTLFLNKGNHLTLLRGYA